MRKWMLPIVGLLVIGLAVPAGARPPAGKGKPPADTKDSCWDIVTNHGATAWNLASESEWPYEVTYPLQADGPACFDLPETPGEFEVSWYVNEGNGELASIYLSLRSEIYSSTECVDLEIVSPGTVGSVALEVPADCTSSIADGYVLMAMIDIEGVRGKREARNVLFTVTGPGG